MVPRKHISRRSDGRVGPCGSAGFTLVELLAVMMIFMLLLGLLVPTVSRVRTYALVQASQAIISQLDGACKLYNLDHDQFPPSTSSSPGWSGSRLLPEALTGYMPAGKDGQEGWGFRLHVPGRKYGPYNDTENLAVDGTAKPQFIDRFEQPILYYRFNGTQYVSSHNANGPPNLNAYLTGPGGEYFRKDFVLISKGPDGDWTAPYSGGKWDRDSDDITNFLSQ